MDGETLNLITAIAAILAAMGTVAAVIVALYLARRDEQQRLRISAATWQIFSRHESREVIGVRVVNIGRRPVHISSYGLRIGFIRKHLYWIKLDENDPDTHHMPTKLEDGDRAVFVVAAKKHDEMIRDIIKSLPWLKRKLAPYSMRFLVYTTSDKAFAVRPNKKLRDRIAQLESHKEALGTLAEVVDPTDTP